jgi:hypothetical protein
VLDVCELDAASDCDGNDVLDVCELAGNDIDTDGVLDACDNCPNDLQPGAGGHGF